MKSKIISLALAATLSLSACAAPGEQNQYTGMGNKQTFGALSGAVIGGVLGSKVGSGSGKGWATGAGAVLGALVGSSVGKSLDQNDLMYHRGAVERSYTAPLNQPITWENPETGHRGEVTPIRQGRYASSGGVCREYKQSIFVDGRAETAVGRACQNADGTWNVMN